LFAFGGPPDSTKIKSNYGKNIKHILINSIDVSGPSIEDGKDWHPDIFGKIGNALHIKTKPWVIKNILLFKAGQRLDLQTIDDSERLLRQSGYFYDARIYFRDSTEHGDVNVEVNTKDKWTLNPQISYNPKNRNGYLGLRDRNFLGIGHVVGVTVNYDENTYIGWGGQFDYTINNIKGSFVNASLNLASNNKSNLFDISFDRSFFTARTKWAGGLGFSWQHDDLRFIDADKSIRLIPHSFDAQDLWAGRSFSIWFGPEYFRRNSSIILSGRYYRKHYSIRPVVLPDSNKIFENHRLYLASFGLIYKEFYKSYFVNGFGVTEDIPVGGMIALTTGSDEREFYSRWYYGMQFVYSTRIHQDGYLSGNFEVGGFRYSNQWEQNIIKLDLIYHSRLIYNDKWKARFFLQNNYILGFNRFEGEQVYLDRKTGMPGFNEFATSGVKRNVLDLEIRLFTPYDVLGFVIGGIVFADYGLISGANQNLLSSRIYQGYGTGFRTKNESISNTNFELALVYNPYNPLSGKGSTGIIFSATFALGTRDFNFDEPEIIKFLDE
jgi:hypothetical protein